MGNSCLITFKIIQKQPPEKFYKKAVLKNFAIFTGKYLCWRHFLIQNIAPVLKNICKRLLLKRFMKLRKVNIVDKKIWRKEKYFLKNYLAIIEDELLAEKVKEYLALFDKTIKGYKEKVAL